MNWINRLVLTALVVIAIMILAMLPHACDAREVADALNPEGATQ